MGGVTVSAANYVIRYTAGGEAFEGKFLALDRDADGGYSGTSRPVERAEDALRLTKAQADALVAQAPGCEAFELPEALR